LPSWKRVITSGSSAALNSLLLTDGLEVTGSVQITGSLGLIGPLTVSSSQDSYVIGSGNVGLGTTSPSQKLHVDGSARVTGAYYDSGNTPGTANQLLASTATGTAWIDPSTIPAAAATLVVIACKNTSGAAIAQGTPVYQTGTVGATATIEIAPADALISANKLPAIGLLQTDLNNNGFGNVVISGKLTNFTTDPIDGLTPTVGDKVFVKSGGGLTLTKPTGEGNGIQNMGLVGRVSGGNAGSITVSSIMRTNDVPNLPEGRIWVGDGNTIVSDTVYIDEPNLRLGIGTTAPAYKLDVTGNVRLKDSASELIINNSTYSELNYGASNYFRANGGAAVINGPFIQHLIAGVEKARLTDTFFKLTSGVLSLDGVAGYTGNGIKYEGSQIRIYQSGVIHAVFGGGNVGIGTTAPTERFHNVGTARFQNTTNSVNGGSLFTGTIPLSWPFPSETNATFRQTIIGQGTTTQVSLPTLNSFGTSGVIGVGGGATGGRANIGVFGYQSFNSNMNGNTNNKGYGGYFLAKGSGSVTDFLGEYIGVYAEGNIGTDIPSGSYGSTTGVRAIAFGATNQTTKGISIYAYGGTTNYAIFAENGQSYFKDNVGIGTTTPLKPLHINTNTNDAALAFRISNENVGGRAGVTFNLPNNTNQNWSVGASDTRAFVVADGASLQSNPSLTIIPGGNVGIGTTTPTYKLDVSGSGRFTGDLTIDGGSITVDPDAAGAVFTWKESDSTTVAGQLRGYANRGDIYLYSDGIKKTELSSINSSFIPALHIGGTTAASGGVLQVTGQGIFTGNVGIGTTAPTSKLHIDYGLGDVAVPAVLFTGGGGVFEQVILSLVDIGTAPNNKAVLEFKNSGKRIATISSVNPSSNATTGGNLVFETTTDDIGTKNTNQLVLQNSGNVGIGTTTPTYKLDVNGTSRFTDTVTFNARNFRVSPNEFYGSITVPETLNSTNNTAYINIGTFSDGFTHIVVDVELVPWLLNTSNIGSYSKTYTLRMTSANPGVVNLYSANVTRDLGTVGDLYQLTTPIANGSNLLQIPIKYIATTGTGNFVVANIRVKGFLVSNIDKVALSVTTPAAVSAGVQEYVSFRTNVGIGTTTPAYKLDVSGTARITSGLTSTGTNYLGINYLASNASINSTGDPNIHKLSNDLIINAGVSPQSIYMYTNSTPVVSIKNDGNVGIGTTAPGATLDIISTTGNTLRLRRSGYDTYTFRNSVGTGLEVYNTTDTRSEMFFDGTGNVGIGTTSPAYKLDVNGQAQFVNGIVTNTGTPVKMIVSGGILNDSTEFRTGNGEFKIYSGRFNSAHQSFVFATGDNYTSGTERMRITSAGNVGIGTTNPTTPLHVIGIVQIRDNVAGNTAFYGGNYVRVFDDQNFNIRNTAGTTVANISLNGNSYFNGGNVGIGTTTPAYKLDVSGSGNFTGDLTVTGSLISNSLTVQDITVLGTASISYLDVTFESASVIYSSGSNIFGDADNDVQTFNGDIVVNGTDLFVDASTSYVGIGTATPTEKLSVAGKIDLNDGGNNVFIGTGAGLNDDASDNRNVGVGYQTLYSNITGAYNTANGFQALYSNTTGTNNTANGYSALLLNTTGASNTANGYRALFSNTTGNNNTANGVYSLNSNTTGSNNTANGNAALFSNTTGLITLLMDTLHYIPTQQGLTTMLMDFIHYFPTQQGLTTPLQELMHSIQIQQE